MNSKLRWSKNLTKPLYFSLSEGEGWGEVCILLVVDSVFIGKDVWGEACIPFL
jgi:hypothetical protein